MSIIEEVEERKKQRFHFLLRCYEVAAGNEGKVLHTLEIGEDLGLETDVARLIVRHLQGEGLIKVYDAGGYIISITHPGIVQIEAALLEPNQPTLYFPPVVNIITAERIVHSQIQQASRAASQVALAENKYEQLGELIESLKESIEQLSLGHQDKTDLQAEIQTIEAQMSKSKPGRTIVTDSLRSIKGILEKVGASLVAQALLQRVQDLLEG